MIWIIVSIVAITAALLFVIKAKPKKSHPVNESIVGYKISFFKNGKKVDSKIIR